MLVILLVLIVSLLVYFLKRTFNYWERNGFPQDEATSIPMGCLGRVVKKDTAAVKCISDVYTRTKGDFVGVYLFLKPALLVRNVDLARDILIKNFANFHDRGVFDGGKKDALNSNLFSQRGKEWLETRKKLSPSFTTGKIRAIFETSNKAAQKLIDFMNTKIPETGVKEIEIKDVFATYAIEILGSILFGLELNGFENRNNKFRVVVDGANSSSVKNMVNTTSNFLFPGLVPYLRMLGIKSEYLYVLRELIKEVIELRKKNGTVRKDILQLLLQLQANGEINDDDNNWTIKSNSNNDLEHFSLDSITAQSFVFYFAGQETTGGTSSFTIAELAMHPHILHKVQKEIDEVLKKHNGQFTYESLQDMEYLELCINEALRKYPGLPTLNRDCTKDFPIPGTDKVIKKGTSILIPVLGYHMDPENFPDPDEFIPERFSGGETPKAYFPFGEGPHKCIAARLGKVNVKLAVARVLHAFNISPMEKVTFEFEPQAVTLLPKGGVNVKFSKRHTN